MDKIDCHGSPKNTVVIPTYNSAKWIAGTIGSVLNQSYENLEVIVVDDGSTDDTESVVRSFKDCRVSYVWQTNAGGPAGPRNAGLKRATGEYISFLDADDAWRPNRLSRVMEVFRDNPNVDIVCHDQDVICEDRKVGVLSAARKGASIGNMYLEMLLRGTSLSPSATALKTRIVRSVGGFDERREFFSTEDFDLWLRLAKNGFGFYFIRESLGVYRRLSNSLSRDIEKHYRARLAVYSEHIRNFPELLLPYRDRILGLNEYAQGRVLHANGQYRKARSRYWDAFRKGYRPLKLYLAWVLTLGHIR